VHSEALQGRRLEESGVGAWPTSSKRLARTWMLKELIQEPKAFEKV